MRWQLSFIAALAIGAVCASPALAAPLDQSAPVRVGGAIRAPQKIKDVPPVYPQIAQEQRVEGVVILELLVDPQGIVSSARVVRSVPMLDEAALEAVLQWEYTPTMLNGQPVSLLYNVTVAFSLRDRDNTARAAAPASTPAPAPDQTAPAIASRATGVNVVQPFQVVRVGGGVRAPVKAVNVAPIYPAGIPAQDAVVILQLLISPEGRVQELAVLRSVPAFDRAAIDAVSQWVYEPTLLNGVPVGVVYNITVAFTAASQQR